MALLSSKNSETIFRSQQNYETIFPILSSRKTVNFEIVKPLPERKNYEILYNQTLGFCIGVIFCTCVNLIL